MVENETNKNLTTDAAEAAEEEKTVEESPAAQAAASDQPSIAPSEESDEPDTAPADDLEFNQDEMAKLYEQSFRTIQEGEVAKGTIVAIENDFVVVDIGYKSEGQIDLREFRDADGNIQAEVGQQVDVLLERTEDDEGTIILSKEKAAKIKVWDEISRVYNEDGVINGTIVGRVKGGMSVDIGVSAFLPGSQVDLRPVRNLDALIGQTFDFKILKFNKNAPTSC